jgi:FtsP/CotA-like multicopper oxidase with cupredoxin domain
MNTKQFYDMKIKLVSTLLLLLGTIQIKAQYNSLWIPDTLTGPTFNLTLKDTFAQLRPTGNQTITGAVNNSNFWGPTLIMNKNQAVQMNVTNKLNDSTTIHWHGLHIPAIMDGGPYQIIPQNTVWSPYWTVKNQAFTGWYHPHLHEMTQEHLTKGVGGFIIVRDTEEAALAIPRKYGVDDIPLALTSRRFLTGNIMAYNVIDNYGDYELVNGTPNPQVTLPKQVVRLRILNAEVQRGYNLGFSDNRTFYVIGNDQGLLNAPVAVTRMAIQTGERYEILVDLSNDAVGSSIDLKAYNIASELTLLTPGQSPFGWPGNEGGPSAPTGNHGPLNGSYLNNTNFNVLHINVGATTIGAITSIPTTLVNNTYLGLSDVTNPTTRTITVTGGQGGTVFTLNNLAYNQNTINQTINVDAVEKWTIVNNNIFGHAFHIHDVAFKIISRSGGNMGTTLRPYEQGWKDVVWLPINGTVTFVAKFSDFSDATWPYMFHCHALTHEDEGMMGTFKVIGTSTSEIKENLTPTEFTIYPNPGKDRIFIQFADPDSKAYYIRIFDAVGRTIFMMPSPELSEGIDVSTLPSGIYNLHLTDDKTKQVISKKFVIE